jgi:hypothetical protein
MKKNWIQKATQSMKQKGTLGSFSKMARSKDMSVKELSNAITKNPTKYASSTVKKANFAKTMQKIGRGKG